MVPTPYPLPPDAWAWNLLTCVLPKSTPSPPHPPPKKHPCAPHSGEWDAAMTAEERGVGDEEIVEAGWDPTYGDRMQELVFIGIRMDEEEMRGRCPIYDLSFFVQ